MTSTVGIRHQNGHSNDLSQTGLAESTSNLQHCMVSENIHVFWCLLEDNKQLQLHCKCMEFQS